VSRRAAGDQPPVAGTSLDGRGADANGGQGISTEVAGPFAVAA
jgi:hypothetical protein